MPKKQREPLTDAQLLLMGILWEKRRATVHQVRDSLPKERPLAYTTVMTTLRYLEWKGYIRHGVDDRTYVYYPVVPREEVVQSTLCHIADRVFHGSAELLMATFLQKQKLSAEKLRKLKELIAAKEKEAKK
jgi:predicted transcriptional regulator